MSNILNHPNCPMRTKLGNCNCGGGFCTSVKKEVCDALHDAYRIGFLNGQRYEKKGETMELISKDEVMKLAESGKLLSGSFGERAKDIIKSIPTVEERKEGHWLDAGWDGEKCSLCEWTIDDTFYSAQFNYCPNCGAKMERSE